MNAKSGAQDVQRTAAQWFAARETGDWSADDEARLEQWLDHDPTHVTAFARAEMLWAAMDEAIPPVPAAALPSVRRVATRRHPSRRMSLREAPRGRWAGGAVAAAIALLLVTAGDLPTRLRPDAITSTGEIRTMTLPDGSHATLDTGTAIAFDHSGRNIMLLRGSAAFQVARDPAHPFTVSTGSGSVTALGTRFLVRQRNGDTQVAVSEHSVRVVAGQRSAIIREGEALDYDNRKVSAVRRVVITDFDAWTRGRIRVVNRPLGEVVRELARYHRGYIGVLGGEVAQRPVSGTFDVHDPVGAIEMIERTLHLRTTRLTDRVIFVHA